MATETNDWGLEIDPEQAHLGGFVKGGDPYSYVPSVWEYLVEEENVASVIDVGCGDGSALDSFRKLGVQDVLGVDGIDTGRTDVAVWDFTDKPFMPTTMKLVPAPGGHMPQPARREFDLCWSSEFVEHIEERYAPGFLVTFAACRLVLFTHAVPGQPGHHHVNCQHADYWIGFMAAGNYKLDENLTGMCRALARGDNPASYFSRTGLAFRRYRDS